MPIFHQPIFHFSMRRAQSNCGESDRLSIIVGDCSKRSMWVDVSAAKKAQVGQTTLMDLCGSRSYAAPIYWARQWQAGALAARQETDRVRHPGLWSRGSNWKASSVFRCLKPPKAPYTLEYPGVAMVTTFLAVMPCNYSMTSDGWW